MVVLDELHEHWHAEVEVLEGRVAPTAVVVGLCGIGRAEVGGGDGDGSRLAPLRIVEAL